MKTTKLYQQNRYIKNWNTVITSVERSENNTKDFLITLKSTAFFPEGGGQSCDTGHINGYVVTDVQEYKGNIYHTVKTVSPDQSLSEIMTPGTAVSCSIDWERRFDNMQRHCGEHILSGIFHSMFGGVNKGFHMGHNHMTIDISLEEKPEITEITFEDAIRAELEANKVIWSDAPVTVLKFDSRKDAEKLPLRKALAFDEDISIVCIGSAENVSDCVACCGTHPDTAGQVGLIKVYKVENYKGMFRIYFEAGQRALMDYNIKHHILSDLSNKYSSSIEDFPKKLKAQEEKSVDIKNELFHLKKAFIEEQCGKLDEILRKTHASEPSSEIIVYTLPQLSTDDVFIMAKKYINKSKNLILLYSQKDTSYILISDGIVNCSLLVKEFAHECGGKGGGNSSSARAIFNSFQDAEIFAEKIRQNYRKINGEKHER